MDLQGPGASRTHDATAHPDDTHPDGTAEHHRAALSDSGTGSHLADPVARAAGPRHRPTPQAEIPRPLRIASEAVGRMLVIAAGLALLVFLVIELRVIVVPMAIAVLLTALLAPRARRSRVDVAARRGFASLVGYVRATVLVAVVDALGIGLGLWATGVPFVLPLAALVFLGAFVPVIGAVLTGAVAVLVALATEGPVTALIVLGVVLAVQQLESHVLQPLLMGRAVRLHPLAVALGVAVGVVVAGIAGALLAVPLLAVLTAAVRSLVASREVAPRAVDPLRPREANPPPALPG